MTTKFTHESIPTKVAAAPITDDVQETVDGLVAAFGPAVLQDVSLTLRVGQGMTVRMTTVQGRNAYARSGEWVVQEAGAPGRFYPVDGEVFAARYRGL